MIDTTEELWQRLKKKGNKLFKAPELEQVFSGPRVDYFNLVEQITEIEPLTKDKNARIDPLIEKMKGFKIKSKLFDDQDLNLPLVPYFKVSISLPRLSFELPEFEHQELESESEPPLKKYVEPEPSSTSYETDDQRFSYTAFQRPPGTKTKRRKLLYAFQQVVGSDSEME